MILPWRHKFLNLIIFIYMPYGQSHIDYSYLLIDSLDFSFFPSQQITHIYLSNCLSWKQFSLCFSHTLPNLIDFIFLIHYFISLRNWNSILPSSIHFKTEITVSFPHFICTFTMHIALYSNTKFKVHSYNMSHFLKTTFSQNSQWLARDLIHSKYLYL